MKQQAAQVYFPSPLYFQIKQIAQEEGQPMATWVRDLVIKEVEKRRKKRPKFSELPTFAWKHIDDPHLSEHIDQVIYGAS